MKSRIGPNRRSKFNGPRGINVNMRECTHSGANLRNLRTPSKSGGRLEGSAGAGPALASSHKFPTTLSRTASAVLKLPPGHKANHRTYLCGCAFARFGWFSPVFGGGPGMRVPHVILVFLASSVSWAPLVGATRTGWLLLFATQPPPGRSMHEIEAQGATVAVSRGVHLWRRRPMQLAEVVVHIRTIGVHN